ncbi:MAG: hypothetical protein M3Y37_01015, partial [Chloroflexota bacterium]|nr:hypothetical protein [Chloroflexota bacterium]
MTTLSLTPLRRLNGQGELWNLFAWFGRACDQAAGILLNPLVVAVFVRSVERDPYRLSWLVVVFGLGWLLGAAISPYLQQITDRAIPWIVGGYIVRTAAIVLMTYAATDRESSADQRYTSIVICYCAYAIATGISRSAQAHHIVRDATHHLREPRKALPVLGLALIFGITALAMWSALSTAQMSWNQSFGRIWMLASVALGVATLAAIREGVDTPESPARPLHRE